MKHTKKDRYVTMIDPPDGARYGFPKALPERYGGIDLRVWLKENAYKGDVDFALENCWYTLVREEGEDG